MITRPLVPGIQPVAQGRLIQAVLAVFALLVQVQQRTVQQGVILRAVYCQPGGFVGYQDLGAVVYDLRRAAGVFPGRAIHPDAFVQHFVQDKQLDLIPGHHTGGQGLLFAVQLDLIFPQSLVQTARIQGGILLHQVIVQPGRGQAFHFQYLHGRFPFFHIDTVCSSYFSRKCGRLSSKDALGRSVRRRTEQSVRPCCQG